jgi:restriction system protein
MRELVYELDTLGGHDFEVAMLELFGRMGYRTERGKLSNDEGRDIILRRENDILVVECKHQRATVGRPVVQKLHSATMTYPGATAGMVVTTSHFSDGARQYAAEKINANHGPRLVLWDHEDIIEQAKRVKIFLVTAGQGTDIFFHVPWRTDDGFRVEVKRQHLSGLRSHPRKAQESVNVIRTVEDLLPAIVVDYEVDKFFSTQAGTIYHASQHGREIFPVVPGSISPAERAVWIAKDIVSYAETMFASKPLAAYFGKPMNEYRLIVAEKLAHRLSQTISYRGRNNQSYSKFCEVRSQDVKLSSKQVLFMRRQVDLSAGPRSYSVLFTDDRRRGCTVTGANGFRDGAEGFIIGDGILCNDCGLISPSTGNRAGITCRNCERTLCASHYWHLPRKMPKRWPRLCSSCYATANYKKEDLDCGLNLLHGYLLASIFSLIPGLPFLLGKRILLGALLPMASILLLFYRPGAIVGVFVISLISSLFWTMRLRLHEKNLSELAIYEPEWH